MPLNELKRIVVSNYQDGTQVSRLPDNEEMMNKINEIIRFINLLEEEYDGDSYTDFGTRKK